MTADLLRLPDDAGGQRVWPVPDTEPVEWSHSRAAYADWITPGVMIRTNET